MKVLAITSYDDHKYAKGPTAVVGLADGEDPDEVFIRWLRVSAYWRGRTRAECLEAPYAWWPKDVVQV